MARPRKPVDELRRFSVHVSLTENEWLTVAESARQAALTVPAFSRAALMGARIAAPLPVAHQKTIFHLERIGANLNQLTARAHSIGLNPHDREALADTLTELRNTLHSIDPDRRP